MARRARKSAAAIEAIPELTKLMGGLDQNTPKFDRDPGSVLDSMNFECDPQAGYSRCAGYERFSGQQAPSSATYIIVQVSSFTNVPSVGQTLTGQTSATTGQIIAVNSTSKYMALTLIVGAGFTTSEVVKVGATTIGTAVPQTVTISALLNAQYLNLAADVYRGLIGTVSGGTTPILGVVSMNNSNGHNVYAVINHFSGTRAALMKATSAGWVEAVATTYELTFTLGGLVAPAEGNILAQGSNTSMIRRVVLRSGSWAEGTAAGSFIVSLLDALVGSYVPGTATIGGVTVTLSATDALVALPLDGNYEFVVGNFTGSASTKRIYGCNGVGPAFEFDGTYLVPIRTGFSTDAPKHIAIHQKQLFLAFESSIANSEPGLPYRWNGEFGASEQATGDEVTGFKVLPGAQNSPTLLVGCRNQCKILYGATALAGTDAALFDLVDFNPGIGCIPGSLQNLDRTYLLDDRGVANMQAAQEYGNFQQACITQNIQTFIENNRARFTCSCVNKDKSQYRLFFSDGSALFITLKNGKLVGMMPLLFPNPVTCVWNDEDANGNDVTYYGSSNGVLYQMERGSSFDGADIDAYFTLSWNFLKLLRWLKTFKKVVIELEASFYVAFQLSYRLGYGQPDIDQPDPNSHTSSPVGGFTWDSFTWDDFSWDGLTDIPVESDLDGTAENIQYTIRSGTDYIYSFTIPSITTMFIKRRLLK